MTHGDHDEAERRLRGALTIYREIGDRSREAQVLQDLSGPAMFRADYEQAADHLRNALAIRREIGDVEGEFGVRESLLRLDLAAQSDPDRALKDVRELYRVSMKLGNARLHAGVLLDYAHVALMRGSRKRAAQSFDNAYKVYLAEGHRHGQANALWGLGQTEFASGRHERALGRLRQALSIYREIGDREGAAKTQTSMAEMAIARREFEPAENDLQEAYAIYCEMNSVHGQIKALECLACLAFWQGNPATGCSRLQAALKIAQEIGSPVAARIQQRIAEYGCPSGGWNSTGAGEAISIRQRARPASTGDPDQDAGIDNR
jgi:tetratricopeptide (TPR) repeat protein